MNKAIDVARYIVNYSNEKGYNISNMKLQKLLYFVQAYFLALTEERNPCFNEKIEAWEFGPVVREVYNEFKQFGASSIPPVTHYYKFGGSSIWSIEKVPFSNDVIAPKDQERINAVIDKFAVYSTSALVKATHMQDPWKNVYQERQNREITQDSIRRYFTNGSASG